MSDQDQRPAEEANPEQGRTEGSEPPPPPPGKKFQIIVVQTIVFAVVFLTMLWLIERHSTITAVLGIAAIVYLLFKKKTG